MGEQNEREGVSFASASSNTSNALNPNPAIIPSQASVQERWLIDREARNALFQEPWYLNQEEVNSGSMARSLRNRGQTRVELRRSIRQRNMVHI